MNTDEKIAAILKMEGDSVEPSAAGWDAITTGISARHARVWWRRGAALAGATAVVLGAVVFVATDRTQQGIDSPPLGTGRPSSAESPAGSASPTPTVVPPAPASTPINAIWPLTTTGEVAAWEKDHSTYPALETASGSATAFARRYLALADSTVAALEGAYGENDFEVRRDGFAVTTLTVKGFGKGGTAPFVVILAKAGQIAIGSPAAGAFVPGSTLVASGSYEFVDPAIDVTLRADDSGALPYDLTKERATTAPEGWSASLSFQTKARTGSLLVTLASNKDGGMAAAAVVPVTFGDPPVYPGPKAMVAARNGRVAVLSTSTGAVVRWLTIATPGSTSHGPELSDDGKTVVYVQDQGTCDGQVHRVPVTGGAPTSLTLGGEGALSHPSARGNVLAYVRTPCVDGARGNADEIVVQGSGSPTQRYPIEGRLRGGPVVGERFVAYVVVNGNTTTLHTVDAFGELGDNPVTAPEGCGWLAPTWGTADTNGRDQLFVAASCSPRDEVVETRIYRFDQDARNRVLVATLDVIGVMTIDYAGEHLVLGTEFRDGQSAYAWTEGTLRKIPGDAERPTWS